MKFAVIGYGTVGKHMARDILRAGHEAVIYDDFQRIGTREGVMACDCAFICVRTPEGPDGSADTGDVDRTLEWLRAPLVVIRSTVPPGTTERLRAKHGGHIVFVPEFIGEGVNNPYSAMAQPPFLIVGGRPFSRSAAVQALSRLYNSECEFILLDACEAEVAKYAENYFLALKVTWANEMRDICEALGVDYDRMMSAVAHDYRIGRSHTHVYDTARGFDGKCLPKDTAALLAEVGETTAPLLSAMRRINERRRNAL